MEPKNHLYHTKYADVLYTIGTADSVRTARKYFSQALTLNKSSIRAYMGLVMCCNAIAALNKGKLSKEKDNLDLFQFASLQLLKVYRSSAPSKVDIAKMVLHNMEDE